MHAVRAGLHDDVIAAPSATTDALRGGHWIGVLCEWAEGVRRRRQADPSVNPPCGIVLTAIAHQHRPVRGAGRARASDAGAVPRARGASADRNAVVLPGGEAVGRGEDPDLGGVADRVVRVGVVDDVGVGVGAVVRPDEGLELSYSESGGGERRCSAAGAPLNAELKRGRSAGAGARPGEAGDRAGGAGDRAGGQGGVQQHHERQLHATGGRISFLENTDECCDQSWAFSTKAHGSIKRRRQQSNKFLNIWS